MGLKQKLTAIVESESEDSDVNSPGHDPFFVHNCLLVQMRLSNNYAETALYTRVIIDTSGKIVQNIKRPSGEWIRHEAKEPKEIVIHFSATLLSAMSSLY
ncbi:hypothetical protein FOCC_FOCC016205 [Frankliniella occidentalis]|nr:hypothetical protein FOCC_FOCC016205 [Frankliniella occidentalis]